MYNENEKKLLSISRAVIDLHGFFIIDTENNIIDNPKILVNLLNERELTRYDSYNEKHIIDKLLIEEAIALTNIITIIDHQEKELNIDLTPAGVISFIAEAVILKSQQFLAQPVETFNYCSDSVNFIEQMIAIISYYTNTKFDEIANWPINQIFKRYAICQKAFPTQINALSHSESNSQEE